MARGRQFTEAVIAERLAEKSTGQRVFKRLWRFCRTKPLGAIGGVLVLFLILVAILADVLAPYDPLLINPALKLQPPDAKYLLGTDQTGRDLLSRIIHGSRISIYVGTLAVCLGTLSGTLLGLIGAYFGGKLDLIIQRIMDSVMSFPMLILAMSLVAMVGASLNNVVIALAIVFTPGANHGH